MAAEFIYTPNPAKIPAFFEKLRAAGKPEKVTLQTIASLGFKSTNERALLPILKGIGFVDGIGSTYSAMGRLPEQSQGHDG